MYISPLYKKTLLNVIANYKNIKKDDFKEEYAPAQRGVITYKEASFENDLQTFEEMGSISIEDDNTSYIKYP